MSYLLSLIRELIGRIYSTTTYVLHRMAGQVKALSKTYFKKNRTIETLIISIFLFGILPTISFRCDLFSTAVLMPSWIVKIVEYLCENHNTAIRNTFLIIMVVHLTEAVLALMLCNYMDYEGFTTFKWSLNVFIHGVFSLRHLLYELFKYESIREGHSPPEVKLGLANFAS